MTSKPVNTRAALLVAAIAACGTARAEELGPRAHLAPYTVVSVNYDGTPNAVWATLTASADFSSPDAAETNLRQAVLLSEGLPRPE